MNYYYQESLPLFRDQMFFQVKKPIRNFSFLHFTVQQEVMKTKNISFINNLLEVPFPVIIS